MEELSADQVWALLDDLLVGRGEEDDDDLPGAELVVSEAGREVFRAALARHARRDDADPAVIWVRPLVASGVFQHGLSVFDLSIARRRALHVTAARVTDGGLDLDLTTGQHARIQPARGAQLAVLQDFDTWTTTLTAEQRSEASALDSD
ncbi:MAG TPA: hypothetical protein VGL47_42495 [Amycolatopsis sp.]|uniref:Uncharacterized protein n=1 Tax=Amycolatopsis nalaikhensis TaxID=715472 RepID=A0ABY8Y264_9PSEU|nr:hypothetical protein [Amycolatopsis sp. 2-2]WIV61876.1 hypothetical protein QP939_26330 [Amycolatopsis sp. 2-2]